MVKAKLIILVALILSGTAASAQSFTWKKHAVDASRTRVTIPMTDNIDKAIGTVDEKGVYTAPSGRRFRGSVAQVARLLIDAQPAMASVKEHVGYTTRKLERKSPQSELTNFIVDCLMDAVAKETGRKVDIGLINFGGIRVDLEEGDILMDDILSMLPFKNNICYVQLKGKDVRALLQQLAAGSMQQLGGVKVVVKDHKLVSAEIGGKPLNDKAVYGLATIDFLLTGGDNISAARNAVDLQLLDTRIVDAILPYFKAFAAQGTPIDYHLDDRITISK